MGMEGLGFPVRMKDPQLLSVSNAHCVLRIMSNLQVEGLLDGVEVRRSTEVVDSAEERAKIRRVHLVVRRSRVTQRVSGLNSTLNVDIVWVVRILVVRALGAVVVRSRESLADGTGVDSGLVDTEEAEVGGNTLGHVERAGSQVLGGVEGEETGCDDLAGPVLGDTEVGGDAGGLVGAGLGVGSADGSTVVGGVSEDDGDISEIG